MADDTFRAAIAAAIALDPAGQDTVTIEAVEGSDFDLHVAIEKAEQVGKSWVIEIPTVGALFEELAKRAGVSVFHLDELPGSVFATTEKLAGGKSNVLVAAGQIGTEAPLEAEELSEKDNPKISKVFKTAEERYVLGVVLVPEVKDSQGDIYSHAEVRKAAHDYMENAGSLGKQHSEIVTGKLKILESYVVPADFVQDEEIVTKGTWLMGIRVVCDDLWSGIKKGSYTGFSIGGAAYRSPEKT